MSRELRPARVTPPGKILSRELEARGWTQRDLAKIMGRPVQVINEIIQSKKQITPETALQLAEVFGTSPELWTNLEASYQLYLARQANRGDEVARRSRLYGLAPMAELFRRKWIEPSDSIEEMEQAVCKFLKIDSPAEAPELAASFRHRDNRELEVSATVAWLRRAEHLAEAQAIAAFEPAALLNAVPEILANAARAEDAARVPVMLFSLGVHFVIVPHLPRTYLDGAAFTLGADGKPVVALSLRYDRIDSFWFTLMHELAHVALRHEGSYLDDLNTENVDADAVEGAANQWARDRLVERQALAAFIAETRPYFSRDKIEGFARQHGRHAGIVLGRLQYERAVEFKQLRGLLVRVSPLVSDWIDTTGVAESEVGRDVA